MPTLIGGDDESAPNPATGLNNAIRQANSASTIGISAHSAAATAQTSDSNGRRRRKPSRKALENAATESTLREEASERQAKRRTAASSAASRAPGGTSKRTDKLKDHPCPDPIKVKLTIYGSTSKAVN